LAHKVFFNLNDNVFELNGLAFIPLDSEVSSFLNSSSSVQLTDIRDITSENSITGGGSFPINLAYVAGSDGVYKGLVDKGLDVVPNCLYLAIIDASGGVNLEGHFVQEIFIAEKS